MVGHLFKIDTYVEGVCGRSRGWHL